MKNSGLGGSPILWTIRLEDQRHVALILDAFMGWLYSASEPEELAALPQYRFIKT